MADNKVLDALKERIAASIQGKLAKNKFDQMFDIDENKAVLNEFIGEPDQRIMYVFQPSLDKILCSASVPAVVKGKACYVLKSNEIKDESLNLVSIKTGLFVSEINGSDALENLSLLTSEVFFPLLSNPANRAGWSGPTSKEVMLDFSNYLANLTMTVGQARGQTLLPLPPPEAFDEDNLAEKERVHLLESSVIQWTNKIKSVLETEPEDIMRQGLNPDPFVEVEFWKAKAVDLSSLEEQLNSDKMKSVLEHLDNFQSAMKPSYEKVTKDVAAAKEQAEENSRYLDSLKQYFNALTADLDFPSMADSFYPLMHSMMLIWKTSPHYNTKPRLICLMQEICNAVVNQAFKYVNGANVFRCIEDEDPNGAVKLLDSCKDVLNTLKDVFKRYQLKCDEALTKGAWDVPEDVVFNRLNQFLERCDDMGDFVTIVVEFSKLEKIHFGGTKGDDLTEQLRCVHADFVAAITGFQDVPYDIMDINVARFDDDFYKYRCKMKDLERRLSGILTLAFDDADSLSARFKLMDSFEGLLDRPIIKDEMDKKMVPLIRQYLDDMNAVQTIFYTKKDDPRIDRNMPPVAGALGWCRSLLDRVKEPREWMATVQKARKEKEPEEAEGAENNVSMMFSEVDRVYTAIHAKLTDYDKAKVAEWTREIDQQSEAKLMQSLLRRDKDTRLLGLNFDSSLVRLLREVKYLRLLGVEVPDNANAIYDKADMFRTQINSLDMLCYMYNDMMDTLHMVERPLVEKDISRIDETVEKGISDLNWNSPEVNDFIKESLDTVKKVFETVKVMKDNFTEIKKMMAEYGKVPLAERKAKTLSPGDFEDGLRKLWATRHAIIKEYQEKVSALLMETNKKLNVNKGLPIWRAYVEYVQDHVRDGLAFTIVNSIKFMCEQLDPVSIERHEIVPLLEIKLGLYASDVLFNAEDSSSVSADDKVPRKSRRDVWQIVADWVEGFFEIGNIMYRMDGSHYVGDLKKNEGIVRYINTLKKHLDWNQKECETIRQEYVKYEFLWKTDRNAEFDKFLVNAMKKEVPEEDGEAPPKEDDEEDEESGGDEAFMPLDKFEEKIIYYRELMEEINNKDNPVTVGWLRINTENIKAALTTWVTKWIHTFTSFLYNDVTRKLNQLEALMTEVNAGMQIEVKSGDSDSLMKVLSYIHQVRSQEKSTVKVFQPLRDTATLLKKYGKSLDEYEMKLLTDAPMKWDSTVNNVYKVKEKVNDLQNMEVNTIITKVMSFSEEIEEFRKLFRREAPFAYEFGVGEAYDKIYLYHQKLHVYEERAAKLTELERVFELAVSKHRSIKRSRAENKMLKGVWDMISIVKHQFNDWKKTLWDQIDTDSLLMSCKKLQKDISSMPKDCQSWKVYIGLEAEVKNLLTVLPLVNLLSSDALEERHWRDLKQSTGKNFVKDSSFCLSDLLNLELHKHVADVEDIVDLANKESKIQLQLGKIKEIWKDMSLNYGAHEKKGMSVPIIVETGDILTFLEENMAALQGMQGQGRYVEFFLEEVQNWLGDLSTVESVLMDWLDAQQKWQSLESIFLGSKDIRQQLPEDSKRFDGINDNWVKLMESAHGDQSVNVIAACKVKGRDTLLRDMNKGLDLCEKSLNMYLETKRKAFPRFYFISNASLLDILSNGYDPQCVQKHFGDCFDGITKLEFEKGDDGEFTRNAIGMHSKTGDEYVPWREKFTCEGAVEDWLLRLVKHHANMLSMDMEEAKRTADHWEIEKKRHEWLFDYCAQIALTASQVLWTEEVGVAFDAFADGNEAAMKDYHKVLTNRLGELIQLVLKPLSSCDRVKIITLITVDVHNCDTVQKLVDEKIQDPAQFTWQSQMRYAYKPENRGTDVMVADATLKFSYEYVGNTGRLVITPLTDRCYITLTQALKLIMGGAPAGPAGTGKTETTKDLGRGMGLPVYVFNCSEQMNVQSMGQIFKGLAQTGAWGCFDEFNRIPVEVLSVVATQVNCILLGIKQNKTEFEFAGEVITLIDTVGMFITMNPGYAGRTELPENLKALFRGCAMVVPDIRLICENMLMSEGFLEARELAYKFTILYALSKDLLSKQMHYDWGLRATKAVLRVAGGLKRGEPEVPENAILMRALRDFNLPKLVDEDKIIFRQLVNDLFPGMGGVVRKFDQNLASTIGNMATKHGLQAEEMFILKTVELSELLAIRHCVFIIGPAGCGKTEIWKTLYRANNELKITTVNEIINPKAVTSNELFGWLSKSDWHDGVLSTVMRNMCRCNPPYKESQTFKWIVLDGDIDPEWIESLNTVMDDNKVLTLVSNERIPLTPAMRLVFEISNLDNATPATVSRAGIIYINAGDVGYKPFLDSWIESRENDKEKSSLLALFNKYLTDENMHEMQKAFKRCTPCLNINLVKSMCRLLEGLLQRIEKYQAEMQKKGTPVKLDANGEKELFESTFVFAGIWAFGGALIIDKQSDERKNFSEWWKRVYTTVKFPKDGTVFDYYPSAANGELLQFTDTITAYNPPADAYLVTKVFVPTLDTVTTEFLLDLLLPNRYPVHLTGAAGTGKTAVLANYLRNLDETSWCFSSINLNYYSTSARLRMIMEGSIDKRSGRIYGPPGTKKLIYFIDDINMPYVDKYNTQSPSCLIRQHMDYGSWWDTETLSKKDIHDCQYIAAMNPTAGSFQIDDRLQGQFVCLASNLSTKDTLIAVYTTILNHHLSTFNKQIQEIGDALVQGTVDLHDKVSTKFLPSTKKFHYQFNMRDFSAIMQGLSMSNSKKKFTPSMFVDLWKHECTRVFSDRLVSEADNAEYDKLQASTASKFFKEVLDKSEAAEKAELEKIAAENEGKVPVDLKPVLIWNTVANPDNVYLPVKNFKELHKVLIGKLEAYNEANAVMDLELFGMAMDHVSRICRIIENPRGNAILVGVGGSGKQSLARLASFICGYDVFQITVSNTYGINNLKEDLQELYMKAGVKGFPITFLLTDAQIVDDEWLVFINDLLSSGFIPNLFADEDMDGILSSISNNAKAAGIPETKQARTDFFINTVRTNLHMVLAMSPVGNEFRVRCSKFPALMNCTTCDWFHAWPEDALIAVSNRFLEEVDLHGLGEDVEVPQEDIDAVRMKFSNHMAMVHLSVNDKSIDYARLEGRYNYTTPKSFLELIDFYKKLLTSKRASLDKQTIRLVKGIDTLEATGKDVALLKEDLTETLVKVAEKEASVKVLIEQVGKERAIVEGEQALADIEAEKANAVAEVANKIATDCARDLAAALPIMEQAKEAVNCLTKASLTTLKSFANPPGNCVYVTNACLILKNFPGKKDWGTAKKMMKDVGKFLEELKSFDATTIEESTIKKVEPIVNEDFFSAEQMASSSEAAANLCGWVVNIYKYNRIYVNVAPKIAAKEEAEGELAVAQAKLKVVEDKVAVLQKKLKEVTDAFSAATAEQTKVQKQAQACQDRLSLAKRLVDGLADEGVRWGKAVAGFKETGRTLAGDVMLAASFISYIGAFNMKYRKMLWEETWLPDLENNQIPFSEGVDPLMSLADDASFARWKNEGLAADRISLENGAILTQCSRWPLMIDPQLQGIKWIRSRTKDLVVIQLNQKKWLNQVMRSVSDGSTLLIEGASDDIDATLNPVLSRAVLTRGTSKVIQIAGEECNYDMKFQLYIQTKLSNPHYKPELFAQCTLINFIVTEEGLEEQLLAMVVNKEKPELEEKRVALVRAINDYMVSLTDLENELLERLSNAPDDILSDVALIEGLEKTKQASHEIEQKVEMAKKQEVSINVARNEFRDVAAEGSWLYFLLIQLCVIDHFYQYSLDAFNSFFMKAMNRSPKAEVVAERVVNLRLTIRLVVFTWVNRGLFEKHKLIFSSMLTFKLMAKGALTKNLIPAEFDYLIRAPKKLGVEKPGSVDWLPTSGWFAIQALVGIDGFSKLAQDMEASPNRFKEWYNKGRPESSPLPLEWRKLDDSDPFKKLLIVRAMRSDRMTSAMADFVSIALPDGKAFTECDAGKSFLDVLKISMEDTSTVNPGFFILSAGADPVQSLAVIAKAEGFFEEKFHRVSLGQGQDIVAMDRLELGHTQGHWIVLENIHLMPRWCKDLEKRLDEYAVAGSHPDFRVFLSAEPSPGIPIGILERSLKLTNEPPQGLKQNLKRAFASFDKDEFEFKDSKIKSIMFGLAWYHAVLIERIKFGPKGWNRGYPFNTGDLVNSAEILVRYLEGGTDKIPWKDLRYMFGEIMYGGHITDDWDRLLNMTFLEFYIKEELLDETEMYPFNENFPDDKFRSPPVLSYDQYFQYIDETLPGETPVAFGLHPNAEIAVKTTESDTLFRYIMELQPRDAGGSDEDGGQTPQARVQMLLEQILEKIKPINYPLDDIAASCAEERGPYQNVFLQECDRMNQLTSAMAKSLKELELGLLGELQMSAKMEALQDDLFFGRVPAGWAKLAYPSLRSLSNWIENLLLRAQQLTTWTEEATSTPPVVVLSYMFNPQSFLTAIMQVTAQKNKLELDKLCILTDVTRKSIEQTEGRARDGAFVTGFFLEGARWNWQTGTLEESLPKEMFSELPVINCRAILTEKMEKTGIYFCPVYYTADRGPTYLLTANLRTKLPAQKWILAGVCMILECDL